jgi:hypothetical protein
MAMVAIGRWWRLRVWLPEEEEARWLRLAQNKGQAGWGQLGR